MGERDTYTERDMHIYVYGGRGKRETGRGRERSRDKKDRKRRNILSTAQGELYWKVAQVQPLRTQNPALSPAS